jgi:hypothetical protein
MKKQIQTILLATSLCTLLIFAATGCSASADAQASPPPQSTPVSPALSVLPESYNTILELRSEGYQTLSLKDFNAAVSAKIDEDSTFLSTHSEFMSSLAVVYNDQQMTNETLIVEDDVYEFINETLNYSIAEIILPRISNPISFSRCLEKHTDEYIAGVKNDEILYGFSFYSLYFVEYRVIDEAALTVQERDDLLHKYQTELQNAVNGMSKKQLLDSGIKDKLQKIAVDLAIDLSTENFVFENAEIASIELSYINDKGEYVNTREYSDIQE